jgi:glycosyltransferase involved in cell wall biosynthesis
MACGIPSIAAKYSALSEWPNGAVHYVDVDETPWMNTNDIDTEHRFMNVASAVEALEYMYQQTAYRKELGNKARKHMEKKCFQWKEIGKQFDSVFKSVLGSK